MQRENETEKYCIKRSKKFIKQIIKICKFVTIQIYSIEIHLCQRRTVL